VTLDCFAETGVYVLVDIEAANRPPSCLLVMKDENGRLVDFALETGVKTRLNACFAQEFATICIMNVPFQPDEMVTRTSLDVWSSTLGGLDPSSPHAMSEATIARWKAIPTERSSQPTTPRNLKVPHLPSM
jgi:hypothetical protein